MLAWNDWMPDFKGALTGFYQEILQPTIESKSVEYKELLKENFAKGIKTQQALVAIALGIFLLLALAFFWHDKTNGVEWKYLALGSLIGYLVPYVLALKPPEQLN